MQLGSTGLPKEESMAPSPTSSESFIFSFSFLGRGVLVPTLQMCESALPQAAPAVCLTRGAVSGRMDFLNLSSCFLYPYLLFCFNLTTFPYCSQYGSSLSSPWTFPTPSYSLNTLTTHLAPSASLSCPTPVPCLLESRPRHIPAHTMILYTYSFVCGAQCGHSMPLAFAGLVASTTGFEDEASFLSLRGDTYLGRKRPILLISQVACAFCEQTTDSGGF